LEYTSHVTGEVIKMFRKPWNANKDGALDLIMSEWDDIAVDQLTEQPVDEDSEEELNSLDENLSTIEE
jgi:hypothetical protein